jgi:hypothetical protein
MSDDLERARESMERAHERHVEHGDGSARNIAILISVLAAGLALAEMQEKGAQNAYMTSHIEVSDDYAFYQSKKLRANLYAQEAELLASLPNAADPAVQARIATAHATATRLEDDEKGIGSKQLLAQAEAHKVLREQQFHRYELFEIVVGALQIAIVLASVSVVTRIKALATGAGVIGAAAIVCGVLITIAVL